MIRSAAARIEKPEGRHPVTIRLDIDWIADRDEERKRLGLGVASGLLLELPPPAGLAAQRQAWSSQYQKYVRGGTVCGGSDEALPMATAHEATPLPEARRLAAEWLRSAVEAILRQEATWLREETEARALAGYAESLDLGDALALLAVEAGGPRWSGPPLDGYEAALRVAATSGRPLAEAIELAQRRADEPEPPRLTPADLADVHGPPAPPPPIEALRVGLELDEIPAEAAAEHARRAAEREARRDRASVEAEADLERAAATVSRIKARRRVAAAR